MLIRLFLAWTLLASHASHCSARWLHQVTSCPISAGERKLDFSALKAGCGGTNEMCTTCVCAVYETFIPAFQAANLTYNVSSPMTFHKAEADNILKLCAPDYVVSAALAGVEINSLYALQQCAFDINTPCLPNVLIKLTPEANAAAAAAAVPPQQDTMMKIVNGIQTAVKTGQVVVEEVQNGVQTVTETGKQAVDAIAYTGKQAVNTVGKAVGWMEGLFG